MYLSDLNRPRSGTVTLESAKGQIGMCESHVCTLPMCWGYVHLCVCSLML